MRKLLVIAFAAALVAAMAAASFAVRGGPQQEIFPEVDTPALKKMFDDKVNFVLVDARTEEEYAQGHIKGAMNIPPSKLSIIAGLLPRNKSIPVIFYCRGYG